MAFRADEAAKDGFERALNILSPYEAKPGQRERVRAKLTEIVNECGPVVDGYPAWHPFLLETDSTAWSPSTPHGSPSFKNLDHTVYLANGIITCPYPHAVEQLFASIQQLRHSSAYFYIERINDVVMHAEGAVPILIKCVWKSELNVDGTIPGRTAIGLMLEREIPNWKMADYSEPWEAMKESMLGEPHGARSSLFVDQQTGQMMKTIWNQLIKTGLWGNER